MGSGVLKYNITETPAATGTAYFYLNFGCVNCILAVNILLFCNTNTALDFIIKPNPVRDILYIELENPFLSAAYVWIYDEAGKLFYSVTQPNLSAGISTAKLPKGTYLIKFIDSYTKQYLT
jgi:hypothetical protein